MAGSLPAGISHAASKTQVKPVFSSLVGSTFQGEAEGPPGLGPMITPPAEILPENVEPEQIPLPESQPKKPAGGIELDEEDEELDPGFLPIGAIFADIRLPQDNDPLPRDRARPMFARYGVYQFSPDRFAMLTPAPIPAGVCYRPLYFQEYNLERYGRSYGVLQPFVSGAHFFGSVPLMPYKLVAQPPGACNYEMDYYPAGTYAPRQFRRPPWRPGAGLNEAALIMGLIFLIP